MQRRLARHTSCLRTASTANSAFRYSYSCTSEPKSTPVCATCAASRSKRSSHSRPRVRTRLLPTAGRPFRTCSVSTSGHRYPRAPVSRLLPARPYRKSLHPSLVSLHPLIGYPIACHRFLACCVSASALLLGTATCDNVTRGRTWERGSSGRSLRPTPRCVPHVCYGLGSSCRCRMLVPSTYVTERCVHGMFAFCRLAVCMSHSAWIVV